MTRTERIQHARTERAMITTQREAEWEQRRLLSKSTPEIVIEIDHQIHKWVIVMGAHRYPTPFLDTTTPDRVINVLKARANGPLTVAINL